MTQGLLHGLRVVEIAHAATEHAGRVLAELGAEVFLVEPPGGSATRRRRPYAAVSDPSRRGIPFLARNAGKLSAVFDPASEDDRAAFRALAASADALIAPADAALLDPLPEVAGPVVLIDDEGVGASAIVTFAASGGMSSSGWPHQPPCNAPSWLALDAAGVYAAGLVLTGVWMVRRGLAAPRYTVSLREAALAGLTPWTRPLMDHGLTVAGQGPAPARLGAGPYPIYRCLDGYVRVLTGTPRQWTAWRALLGEPEVLSGAEWESAQYRAQNFDALFAICSELTRERKRDELFREGQRLGLTITPVLGPADFPEDPHIQARALFHTVADPGLGAVRMMRPPQRYPGSDLDFMPAPAPALGAHTDAARAPHARPPIQVGQGNATPAQPLRGIRVLNLGVGAVVPELASLMALLGAEVIKIESRRYVDFLRRGGGGDPNASPTFNQLNLGVLSAAVDMSTEPGREVVRRLIPHCDIMMENMRGDVVPGWGLDYEHARRIKPNIIYLSSQGLGEGVYNGFQTFGPNLQAFSGVTALWAHPDDPFPVGTTLNHPDHLAGKQMLAVLLAALLRREQTGEGLFIDGAQFEFAASLIADKFLQEHLLPGTTLPLGNRSPDEAPHGTYPCQGGNREQGTGNRDEAGPQSADLPRHAGVRNPQLDEAWIAIACRDDRDWAALVAVIDQPWAREGRFATAAGRLQHVEELDQFVAAWTRQFTAPELEARLRAAGVAASRVVTGPDMVAREDDHHDGVFATVCHPSAGCRWYTGLPFREAATGRPALRRPPLLGEHTEYVLYDILGLPRAEMSRLMASGAVGS